MLINKKKFNSLIIKDTCLISDVIKNMNISFLKIVLVVNKKNLFRGIIEDGDIRRAFLSGYKINSPISKIINVRAFTVNDFFNSKLSEELNLNNHRNIPIIKNKRVIALYVRDRIKNSKKRTEDIVIMAGGFGKRLEPLTKNCPKILLRYKDQTILEHLISMIKKNNFTNVTLTVFYLKKLIQNFVKKNNSFNLNIKFLQENKPEGTIGSIGNLKNISDNFIVMNCDQLSDLNLKKLFLFHYKKKSLLTICAKTFKYSNPYGVINDKKKIFKGFIEKPTYQFKINAGIYVFNKKIISIIRKYNLKNFDKLLEILKKKKNNNIFIYDIKDNWLDLSAEKENLKSFH
jgi:dTDP-glucose pyrophosphorylase